MGSPRDEDRGELGEGDVEVATRCLRDSDLVERCGGSDVSDRRDASGAGTVRGWAGEPDREEGAVLLESDLTHPGRVRRELDAGGEQVAAGGVDRDPRVVRDRRMHRIV